MSVIFKGMAKPHDPIYKTGLTVSAARPKPLTPPSPSGVPSLQWLDAIHRPV